MTQCGLGDFLFCIELLMNKEQKPERSVASKDAQRDGLATKSCIKNKHFYSVHSYFLCTNLKP